mmetsp:Transcript_6780/g.14990  ORF Transcript_6780/g.14990 Transcript_6780/m.14990 type:complete len:383 (-) Transcript_6780:396-1544(-)
MTYDREVWRAKLVNLLKDKASSEDWELLKDDDDLFNLLVDKKVVTDTALRRTSKDELLEWLVPAGTAAIIKAMYPSPHEAAAQPASTMDDATRELLERTRNIERIALEGSQATRHASTITDEDLDAVEASLRICFAPADDTTVDPAADASYQDTTAFQWEENKPEAKHRKDYLAALDEKVKLPGHLRWSDSTDKADVLKASMHAGGASMPFSIGWRTDAMVVATRRCAAEEASIVATVELKKKVVRQSLRQTKATYVCASLKSQLPVISCVTDMSTAAVAYYTAGQRRQDGTAICYEHFFRNADAMMMWLSRALATSSVPADVMQFSDTGVLVMPDELPNPKRIRLPMPPNTHAHTVGLRSLLPGLFDQGSDVACLRDVETD